MSVTTVRSTIKTYLDTITWSWQIFAYAFNYFTEKANWYPYVMFEPSNDFLQSEFEDTWYNSRRFSFDVVIVQEMTNTERQQALDIIVKGFEAVINLFDDDRTLGGVVKMVDAVQWWLNEGDLWEWPCFFATMKIECLLLHDINS